MGHTRGAFLAVAQFFPAINNPPTRLERLKLNAKSSSAKESRNLGLIRKIKCLRDVSIGCRVWSGHARAGSSEACLGGLSSFGVVLAHTYIYMCGYGLIYSTYSKLC